jgi:uncharacterized protein (DUF433 family)
VKKIVKTIDTCGGSPRIDGTRLTCADVVITIGESGDGLGVREFLGIYDYLDMSDVLETLRYCSEQSCRQHAPHVFCHGCTLDTRKSESPWHDPTTEEPCGAEVGRNIWESAARLLASTRLSSEKGSGTFD